MDLKNIKNTFRIYKEIVKPQIIENGKADKINISIKEETNENINVYLLKFLVKKDFIHSTVNISEVFK